jgi:hypothetical protein
MRVSRVAPILRLRICVTSPACGSAPSCPSRQSHPPPTLWSTPTRQVDAVLWDCLYLECCLLFRCHYAGITLVHLPIQRNAALNSQLMTLLMHALRICLDVDSHPSIYVHCLDGRRITGLFVLLLRKLQGWQPSAAFTEFWRFQTVLKPTVALIDMKKMTEEIGKFMTDCCEPIYIPSKIPRWLWGGDRSKGFSSTLSQVNAVSIPVITSAQVMGAYGIMPSNVAVANEFEQPELTISSHGNQEYIDQPET